MFSKQRIAAAFTTVCLMAGATFAASAQTIKVGIVGPFSGPFAHYGTLFKNGAEAYIAAQGGKLAGKDVELIYRDTGGPNPGQTKTLVQELIVKDKVDYLGGFVFTPNAFAVAPLIQQSQTPAVVFNAATSSITDKSEFFIRTSYTLWQVTVPLAQWAAKNNIKKVVTAVTDYGPGIDAETAWKSEFTKQGGTVVESIRMPIATTDFSPFVQRIKASGAQAVLTGNWGNDLTLLVKAARDVGFEGRFYTFYGNALGAPAAIGDAGIGKVVAVADWLPNVPTAESAAFYKSFRERFPKPQDDYVHMRMQLMIEALAQAIERARSTEPRAVAAQLERADVTLAGQRGQMRAQDHQFQQSLVVGMMERKGTPGVPFDVEGSGYGFRVVRQINAEQAALPSTCKMVRPA